MSHHDEKKACQDYYRNAADNYNLKRFSSMAAALVDEVYKQSVYFYLKDCEKILDAGTGTGRFAIFFAKKGKKIIALDSSIEMLNEARNNAINEGVHEMIEFIHGDIEDIPLDDASIDGISCIHVLVHYSDTTKAINEISRILKPKGKFIFEKSNRYISYYYNKIWAIFSREKHYSYKDYYHDDDVITSILTDNNIIIRDTKKVKKIPKFILYLMLDIIRQRWVYNFLLKYERYNFGWVKIINGVKT